MVSSTFHAHPKPRAHILVMHSLLTAGIINLDVNPCGPLQISTGLQPFYSQKHVTRHNRIIGVYVEQLFLRMFQSLFVELDAPLSQAVGKAKPIVGDQIFKNTVNAVFFLAERQLQLQCVSSAYFHFVKFQTVGILHLTSKTGATFSSATSK